MFIYDYYKRKENFYAKTQMEREVQKACTNIDLTLYNSLICLSDDP